MCRDHELERTGKRGLGVRIRLVRHEPVQGVLDLGGPEAMERTPRGDGGGRMVTLDDVARAKSYRTHLSLEMGVAPMKELKGYW